MLVVLAVFACVYSQADAVTACVYRCDRDWPGLDTGICKNYGCPSPDSWEVSNNICWGLPFAPGPGDILQHEIVPFATQDACEAYLSSWQSRQELASSSNLTRSNSDLTSYEDRGQIFNFVTTELLGQCTQHRECQAIIHGPTGKDLQNCINECIIEIGTPMAEKYLCDAAVGYFSGGTATGLAKFFCNHALSTVMEPINQFFEAHFEQPIVNIVDHVENAVASIGRAVTHFFNFWSPWSVVV